MRHSWKIGSTSGLQHFGLATANTIFLVPPTDRRKYPPNKKPIFIAIALTQAPLTFNSNETLRRRAGG